MLVDFSGDVGMTLFAYARRARVMTAFEAVPGARNRFMEGRPPLDLTGMAPADAVSRIAGLDGRYDVARSRGVFVVRPKTSIVDGTPLDLAVREFRANDETAAQVLRRLVGLIGGDVRSVSGTPYPIPAAARGDAGEQARYRERERAFARKHSFTLRNTTLREILTTLCQQNGTASWRATMQSHFERGAILFLLIESWEGWIAGAQFNAPPWEPSSARR
jgi:hypothetical protein